MVPSVLVNGLFTTDPLFDLIVKIPISPSRYLFICHILHINLKRVKPPPFSASSYSSCVDPVVAWFCWRCGSHLGGHDSLSLDSGKLGIPDSPYGLDARSGGDVRVAVVVDVLSRPRQQAFGVFEGGRI